MAFDTRRIRRIAGVLAVTAVALSLGAAQALAAAGELDRSYGGGTGTSLTDLGGYEAGNAMALQPDGKIVVAGYTTSNGRKHIAVVRLLNPQGSLDSSFGAGGRSDADLGGDNIGSAVALQADGRIVVAGQRYVGTGYDLVVTRLLNPSGDFDPTYGAGGWSDVELGGDETGAALALQRDGRIVVAGSRKLGAGTDFAVARLLNPQGAFDPSYGGGSGWSVADLGGSDIAGAVALQRDGKIVVAGSSTAGGSTDFAVARLLSPKGSFDPSYGGSGRSLTDFGGEDVGTALALQPDGKIVVAGYSDVGGTQDFAVVRRLPDGTPDPSFGSGGKVIVDLGGQDFARAVAVQPDGKIVIAGSSDARGTTDFAVTRLRATGSPDPTFGNGGKAFVDFGGQDRGAALALQPDGKIVVAGSSNAKGVSDIAVARLQGDPARAPSGGGGGGGPQSGDSSIQGLRANPAAFRAAAGGASIAARPRSRTGTTISYRIGEAATTSFTVLRGRRGVRGTHGLCVKPPARKGSRSNRHRRCTRYVAVGSFTHRDSAGAVSFHFTGRVRGRKLKPGGYRLSAAPSSGEAGDTARISFRIIG